MTIRMKTKLFVSANLSDDQLLVRFALEKKVDLFAQSLIDFIDLKAKTTATYAVVFFSSPRAFNYFISSNNVLSDASIALIGEGTKKYLNDYFSQIGFVGKNAGNPSKVAADFKAWLGDRTVLFPQAKKSHETISSVIPQNQKIVLPVYETVARPVTVPPQDVYVFTSPSNVTSFLQLNEVPISSKIIAWGATTRKACEKQGIAVWKTLKTSTYEELISLMDA
jgi:uroporphyrinogen-III synthase